MNYLNKINLKLTYGNKKVIFVRFRLRHAMITSCHDIVSHDKQKKKFGSKIFFYIKKQHRIKQSHHHSQKTPHGKEGLQMWIPGLLHKIIYYFIKYITQPNIFSIHGIIKKL